ncbi:hypothetical protein [Cupriavidus necator]
MNVGCATFANFVWNGALEGARRQAKLRRGSMFPCMKEGRAGSLLAPDIADAESARETRHESSCPWGATATAASVPIFDGGGQLVGAITLSGPNSRLGQAPTMVAAVAALLSAAKTATDSLGGSGVRFGVAQGRLNIGQFATEEGEQTAATIYGSCAELSFGK